jgi:hypothetical protein
MQENWTVDRFKRATLKVAFPGYIANIQNYFQINMSHIVINIIFV